MFKCGVCSAHTDAGEKMTRIVMETRPKAYVEKGRLVGRGSEIVREAKACFTCAARLLRQGFVAT